MSHIIKSEPAHTILTETCLSILLQVDDHMAEDDLEQIIPLARYAAEYWISHAQFKDV